MTCETDVKNGLGLELSPLNACGFIKVRGTDTPNWHKETRLQTAGELCMQTSFSMKRICIELGSIIRVLITAYFN